MRELKFRAWLDEYKQYLYFGGDYKEQTGRWGKGRCTLAGNNHIAELYANEDNSNMFYQVHKVECIEQYTGLKDKNSKEIYEGDIIEYDWYIQCENPAYRVKEQVVFDDRGARVGNDRIRNCTSVVVIGNIHENPELIEKEQ